MKFRFEKDGAQIVSVDVHHIDGDINLYAHDGENDSVIFLTATMAEVLASALVVAADDLRNKTDNLTKHGLSYPKGDA